MSCPGSYKDGCRCVDHAMGLAEYARDPDAYLAALERAVPVRLHVVTPGPEIEDQCDGSMLCTCTACVKERVGRKPRPVRQPWQPRRAA